MSLEPWLAFHFVFLATDVVCPLSRPIQPKLADLAPHRTFTSKVQVGFKCPIRAGIFIEGLES